LAAQPAALTVLVSLSLVIVFSNLGNETTVLRQVQHERNIDILKTTSVHAEPVEAPL
jgi:hypothetical protein